MENQEHEFKSYCQKKKKNQNTYLGRSNQPKQNKKNK